MKEGAQFGLFAEPAAGPDGFLYTDSFLSAAEEQQLASEISSFPFAPFQFHGFEGKRRIVSFGWRYGFDGSGLARAEPTPSFLLPIRARAAAFADVPEEVLEQLLVIEYGPGQGLDGTRIGRSSTRRSAFPCFLTAAFASAVGQSEAGIDSV